MNAAVDRSTGQHAADALQAYVDAGFDTFDMADHYGSAELIAGRLLARYPAGKRRPLAFTKWCPEPGAMTAEVVRKGVQERLERLGVEKIDLLQLHWWTFDHPAWLDALHEMNRLREQGLIGELGVTNFDAAHLALALADGIPLVSNQVSFSLLDRRATGPLSDVCTKSSVKLLAYGTLCGGFLSDKWLGQAGTHIDSRLEPFQIQTFHRCGRGLGRSFQAILSAAGEIARKHAVSISNVATAWVLDHPAVGAAIIGARITESEHRADNLKVLDLQLDAEDKARLDVRLRRKPADPRRLRRRISPPAVSDRIRRSQPPSRCHTLRIQGRACAGPARPPAGLIWQHLGTHRRL